MAILSNYYLKLQQFEGPLDLLLHLIKVNEIDIFNIDIFVLTNQYLEYLRILKFDDLADAGEFLEMAASLIEIKSKMLLPREEAPDAAELMEDEDPRKDLQERLIQYEQFKQVAEHFSLRPQYGLQIRASMEWKRIEPLFSEAEAPIKGDPASLVILYEQMLKTVSEKKPTVKVEATTHMVSIDEKIEEIEKLLTVVKFTLFQGFYKQFKSRYELVIYILAMLELSRWGKLKIYQQESNGPIWIYQTDFDEKLLPVSADTAGVGEANNGMMGNDI